MDVPHYFTADQVQRLLDTLAAHNQHQARTGERRDPRPQTTVSAMRTRNETEETLDPSPRPRAIITPGRGLIQIRR